MFVVGFIYCNKISFFFKGGVEAFYYGIHAALLLLLRCFYIMGLFILKAMQFRAVTKTSAQSDRLGFARPLLLDVSEEGPARHQGAEGLRSLRSCFLWRRLWRFTLVPCCGHQRTCICQGTIS